MSRVTLGTERFKRRSVQELASSRSVLAVARVLDLLDCFTAAAAIARQNLFYFPHVLPAPRSFCPPTRIVGILLEYKQYSSTTIAHSIG